MGSAPFLKCQTLHWGLLKHGWNTVPNWHLTSWHWVEHCISIEKAILATYLPSKLPRDYLHLKSFFDGLRLILLSFLDGSIKWSLPVLGFILRFYLCLHEAVEPKSCSGIFLKQENWKKWGPVVCAFPWCCCLMKFLDLAFKMWLLCVQAP